MPEEGTGLCSSRLGHQECLQHIELEEDSREERRLPGQLLRILRRLSFG